jgi:hypothetical protein
VKKVNYVCGVCWGLKLLPIVMTKFGTFHLILLLLLLLLLVGLLLVAESRFEKKLRLVSH